MCRDGTLNDDRMTTRSTTDRVIDDVHALDRGWLRRTKLVDSVRAGGSASPQRALSA